MKISFEKLYDYIRKYSLLIAASASIIVVFVFVLRASGFMQNFSSLESARAWIQSMGNWGLFAYGTLVFFQVIILPIPSTLTNYAALLVFDPLETFLVTTIVTIFGSYICYFLGRIFGKRLLYWLADKEQVDKYAEIINKRGRLLFVLMMAFPFFPDDMLCLIAGMSSMKPTFFSCAILLARPIMIALISFGGAAVINALDTWGIPVMVAAIVVITVAAIIIMRMRDKKTDKDSAESN